MGNSHPHHGQQQSTGHSQPSGEQHQDRSVSLKTWQSGASSFAKCDNCQAELFEQKVPAGCPYMATTSCNQGFTCFCSRTVCYACWQTNASIAGYFGDTNTDESKQAFINELSTRYADENEPLKDKIANREVEPDINANYVGYTPESWTWFGASRKCTRCR